MFKRVQSTFSEGGVASTTLWLLTQIQNHLSEYFSNLEKGGRGGWKWVLQASTEIHRGAYEQQSLCPLNRGCPLFGVENTTAIECCTEECPLQGPSPYLNYVEHDHGNCEPHSIQFSQSLS